MTSLNVQSAGSKPAGYVHPLAVQVMKEIGIDISGASLQAHERIFAAASGNGHHGVRQR